MVKKRVGIALSLVVVIAAAILLVKNRSGVVESPSTVTVEQATEVSTESSVNEPIQIDTKKNKGLEDLSGDDIEVYIKEVEQVPEVEQTTEFDYTCDVDWSNGELTSEEFTTVKTIAVKQYENILNKESTGRYTVVEQVLTPEDLVDSKYGSIYYWVNEIGVLYAQTKLAIYDSKEGTESVVVKVLPIAYDCNTIVIYEG